MGGRVALVWCGECQRLDSKILKKTKYSVKLCVSLDWIASSEMVSYVARRREPFLLTQQRTLQLQTQETKRTSRASSQRKTQASPLYELRQREPRVEMLLLERAS